MDNVKKNNIPKEYIVTAEGSLGLLALGAVGVKLWKEKKRELTKLKHGKENKNG